MSYYDNAFDTTSRYSNKKSRFENNSSKSSFGSRKWDNEDRIEQTRNSFLKNEYNNDYDDIFSNSRYKNNYDAFPTDRSRENVNSEKKHYSKSFDKDDEKFEYKQEEPDRHFSNTLLPEEYISVSSQQLFALAIYGIIQAYKIYDLFILKSSNNIPSNKENLIIDVIKASENIWFLLKYFVIEFLFFTTLPIMRIPLLKFKPIFSALLILSSSIINLVLVLPIFSWILVPFSINNIKKKTITGEYLQSNEVINVNDHFKGKHIIKLLPESVATFNPFNEIGCISKSNSLQIPIKVNSTSHIHSWRIQYKGIEADSYEYLNVTTTGSQSGSFIAKLVGSTDNGEPVEGVKIHKMSYLDKTEEEKHLFHSDSNIQYYQMNIEKPGYYKVMKGQDSNGFVLKMNQLNHFIAPICPEAMLFSNDSPQDKCLGDFSKYNIEVKGVFPLKLKYSKIVDGIEEVFEDYLRYPTGIEKDFESPFLNSGVTRNSLQNVDRKYIENFKWASNNKNSINIEEIVKQSGVYSYTLKSITDAFENTVELSSNSEFKVHQQPRVELSEVNDRKSKTKKALKLQLVNYNLKHEFSDSPITVNISYNNGESFMIEKFNVKQTLVLPINNPGVYTLVDVKSKFCNGLVLNNDQIIITEPIPPTLEVKSSNVTDQCVGSIGLNFDLKFNGLPDFKFQYKVFKKNFKGLFVEVERKEGHSSNIKHHFQYMPKSEGDYKVVFTSVSNGLFPEQKALYPESDYSFETKMNVKPGATILSKNNYKPKNFNMNDLCLNDDLSFEVELFGEKPWFLEYDILETSTGKRESIKLDNLIENKLHIKTNKFEKGGHYIISLSSIKDKTNCKIELINEEISFDVRAAKPSLSFNPINKNELFEIIKKTDSTNVPLKLSGQPPFTIGYTLIDEITGVESAMNFFTIGSNQKQEMSLSKKGTYVLKSVKDKHCFGVVSEINNFTIKYLSTPSLQLDTSKNTLYQSNNGIFAKQDVCLGVSSFVDFKLEGIPPFTITYDLIKPNNVIERDLKLKVINNFNTLPFDNLQHGINQIIIKNINDANYGTGQFLDKKITVQQKVNALPLLKIHDTSKEFKTCFANIDETTIPKAPIALKSMVEIDSNSKFEVLFKIFGGTSNSTSYLTLDAKPTGHNSMLSINYNEIYSKLRIGNYLVTIESIRDLQTGCIGYDLTESSFNIVITDIPSIQLAYDEHDYCVGETIKYQIDGTPPFDLQYKFNNVISNTVVTDSEIQLLASKPGLMSINHLKNKQSNCLVNFLKTGMENYHERLNAVIHQIPTVYVSQGETSEDDIHEGDVSKVVFEFKGEPPFSLVYVKYSEETGEKLETFSVSDINEHEYIFETSSPGIYEAIEIKDKYCEARRELV
ncbi:hypothetical protein ACO0SA_000856 [Hanseniaspora valbyensis]